MRVTTDVVGEGVHGEGDAAGPVGGVDGDVVDTGTAGGCGGHDGDPGSTQPDAVVLGGDPDGDGRGRLGGEADDDRVGDRGRGVALDDLGGLVGVSGGVDGDDFDGGSVIVADRHLDVADDGVVEGGIGGDDRVADDDDARALGERVVGGDDRDGAGRRAVPGGRGEEEHEGVGGDVDELAVDPDIAVIGRAREHRGALGEAQGVAAGQEVRGRGAGCRDGDIDVGRRLGGEVDPVGVGPGSAFALADSGEAAGLLDDDLALVGAGDDDIDARGREAVVCRIGRGEPVADRARRALDLAGDHAAGHVARDIDDVTAEAADDACGHPGCGGEDVEDVVALEAVDLEDLDRAVVDGEAGAIDTGGRHDDVVCEFGAEDDDLVDARAAVDGDRGVDVVLHLVVAGSGADVVGGGRGEEAGAQQGHRDRVGRVAPDDVAGHRSGGAAVARGLGERERPDDEEVVAVLALEPQGRLVGVDGELVVTGAATGGQRLAGAGAEPAAGRRDRAEDVVRGE